MDKIFALVDCNNFYPSCERLFDFTLRDRPVIVLSNNDGRVIARSNEAKALGIKMGDPAFMLQDLIKEHQIVVLSSNYALYFDIRDRVREVLSLFTPRLDKYSIDECFLDLSGIPKEELEDYGRRIKAKGRTMDRNPGLCWNRSDEMPGQAGQQAREEIPESPWSLEPVQIPLPGQGPGGHRRRRPLGCR